MLRAISWLVTIALRRGSHGYRPTDKQIAERADIQAFAASRPGLTLSVKP